VYKRVSGTCKARAFSAASSREKEDLESRDSLEYGCTRVFDVDGTKLPFAFTFDYGVVHDDGAKVVCEAAQEAGMDANALRETLKQINQDGTDQLTATSDVENEGGNIGRSKECVAHEHVHAKAGSLPKDDSEIVHHEFITLVNQQKVRMFGAQPSSGSNNDYQKRGTREYRSLLLVFWPRKHTSSSFCLTYGSYTDVLSQATAHAHAHETASAVQFLEKAVLVRSAVKRDNLHDASVLETCAMVGSEAAGVACKLLSAIKEELMKTDQSKGPTHPYSTGDYFTSLWDAALKVCISIGVQDIKHVLSELASGLPLSWLVKSFFALCCNKTVAAAAPELEQILFRRFSEAEDLLKVSKAFFNGLVTSVVTEERLFEKVQVVAGRLGEFPFLSEAVDCMFHAQEQYDTKNVGSGALRAEPGSSANADAQQGNGDKDMSNSDCVPSSARQALTLLMRTLIDVPKLLDKYSFYTPGPLGFSALCSCVIACKDLELTSRFVNCLVDHASTRGIVRFRDAVIESQQCDEVLPCLMQVLHLRVEELAGERIVSLLIHVKSQDHWTGVLEDSPVVPKSESYHKRFATFAVGLIASALSVSPPRFTFLQTLSVIETLCSLKFFHPDAVSLAVDLSGIASENVQAGTLHLVSRNNGNDDNSNNTFRIGQNNEERAAKNAAKKAARALVALCAFFERNHLGSAIDACMAPGARLGGADICTLIAVLDEWYITGKEDPKEDVRQLASQPWYSDSRVYQIWSLKVHADYHSGIKLRAKQHALYCAAKLVGGLDTQGILGVAHWQLPCIASLILQQMAHIQGTDRILADMEQVVRTMSSAAKESVCKALFDSCNVDMIRAGDCMGLRALANCYIDILNHQPSARPPQARTDFSLLGVQYPQSPHIDAFLRSPNRSCAIGFNNVKDARNFGMKIKQATGSKVVFGIQGKGATTVINLIKDFARDDQVYNAALQAHCYNRQAVEKLGEAFVKRSDHGSHTAASNTHTLDQNNDLPQASGSISTPVQKQTLSGKRSAPQSSENVVTSKKRRS
jgi:hypothetical protein